MSGEPGDFDLQTAWLRRAKGDMRAFAEALAVRLEAALPGVVEIERRRDGLFARTSHVSRIVVRQDGALLSLDLEHGRLRASRAKVVRGVTLSTETIDVPAWLEAVLVGTRRQGEQAGAAHAVLHDFLMS